MKRFASAPSERCCAAATASGQTARLWAFSAVRCLDGKYRPASFKLWDSADGAAPGRAGKSEVRDCMGLGTATRRRGEWLYVLLTSGLLAATVTAFGGTAAVAASCTVND